MDSKSLATKSFMDPASFGWVIATDLAKPELSADDKSALVSSCYQPKKACPSRKLGGRTILEQVIISDVGPCLVKSYRRGGLLGKVFGYKHYRSKKEMPRAVYEYECLQKVRELGVSAPKPVAAFWTKGSLYRSWLVLEEIENTESVDAIAVNAPHRLPKIFNNFLSQLEKLIEKRFFHLDLHPGNILVTKNDEVWIVDFDKAYVFSGSERELRRKYLSRWRRAILKHGLPDNLIEFFSQGLLKNSHVV